MINWGAVPTSSVLPFFFASYDGATGASEAISGLAVTDIEVYKGISTTQRSSDAGYTLMDTDGIDVDGHVGINGFSIDTGDNTDAGFYVAGSFYTVVVASVTADGQTVNFVAGTFRLIAADQTGDSFARLGAPAGASVSADVAAVKVDTAAILVDTGTTLDGKIDVIDGIVDSILVDTAVIGTPAGASIAADIAAIEAQTDDIGVAGLGLTAIPWNAAWDAEVQSEVADALAVYDPPTHAELVSEVDTVQTDVAAVKSDTAAILVDTGTTLDGKLDTIDTNVDSILADTGTDGVVIVNGGITTAKFGAGAIDAAALAADAANEIADALLNRNVAGGSSAGRLVKHALYRLINRVAVAAGTLTVYGTDDSTGAFTQTVTTAAGDPITEVDTD